jgi:membrane-associated protein
MGLADPVKLRQFVELGGWWVGYAVLAAVIFSETGLLVGFFLPGDSLLFAAGFLASSTPPVFDLGWLIGVLAVAAIVGDAVNYHLGAQMGEHVFEKGRLRFVKHKHLLMAKEFYETYGPLAIVLARFAPLVRTFTPFVAGVARMHYRRFVAYNVAGGVGWVFLMTMLGFWLGQFDFIQRNFEKSVLVVVVLSIVLPLVIGALKHRRQAARERAAAEALASADTVEM